MSPWTVLAPDHQPASVAMSFCGWVEERIGAITTPTTIDSHVAFIRSTWEGARNFAQSPDDPVAYAVVGLIQDEIALRRQAGSA